MIRSRQRLVRQSSHPLLRVVVPLAVLGALLLGAAPALGHEFTPRLVISDAQMRDYDSMSAAQIQAFLNRRSGPLKRMSFARHDGGPTAPASVIIWEAAQAWHINPKVLLTMLQKEQSLLTRRTLARNTLSRAMGEIEQTGAWARPSQYSDQPYLITRGLIEEGRNHLLLDNMIETGCPVRILQGVQDPDVPWQHAVELTSRFARDDVVLTLVKDGDHRLSRPEDIERLIAAVAEFARRDATPGTTRALGSPLIDGSFLLPEPDWAAGS